MVFKVVHSQYGVTGLQYSSTYINGNPKIVGLHFIFYTN